MSDTYIVEESNVKLGGFNTEWHVKTWNASDGYGLVGSFHLWAEEREDSPELRYVWETSNQPLLIAIFGSDNPRETEYAGVEACIRFSDAQQREWYIEGLIEMAYEFANDDSLALKLNFYEWENLPTFREFDRWLDDNAAILGSSNPETDAAIDRLKAVVSERVAG